MAELLTDELSPTGMSQSFQGDPQGPGRGAPLGFPCLFSVMDLDLDALPLFGLELFK